MLVNLAVLLLMKEMAPSGKLERLEREEGREASVCSEVASRLCEGECDEAGDSPSVSRFSPSCSKRLSISESASDTDTLVALYAQAPSSSWRFESESLKANKSGPYVERRWVWERMLRMRAWNAPLVPGATKS